MELIKNLYLRFYSENQIVDELARRGIELADTPEAFKIAVHRKIEVVQKRQLSNLYQPDDLQLYNVWKVFQMPQEQIGLWQVRSGGVRKSYEPATFYELRIGGNVLKDNECYT